MDPCWASVYRYSDTTVILTSSCYNEAVICILMRTWTRILLILLTATESVTSNIAILTLMSTFNEAVICIPFPPQFGGHRRPHVDGEPDLAALLMEGGGQYEVTQQRRLLPHSLHFGFTSLVLIILNNTYRQVSKEDFTYRRINTNHL